jgi:hypothetical protein
MKAIPSLKKVLALTVVTAMGLLVSCTDENLALQEEAALITEDVVTDYYFEDTDDMAGLVLLSDDGPESGGRVAESRPIQVNDNRFNCAGVVITITIHEESTLEMPKGEIVIDFGDGCVDVAGNERKGKIVINFEGRRFKPGSTVVTTFIGYSVNGIALSGTRTLTNMTGSITDAPKFRVQLEGGKITWPDGTEATREHCFVREWIRAANPLNDAMIVSQCEDVDFAAEGINRRGKAYQMIIVEPLMYKRGCPLAVSGVKQFIDVASGKVILVDYGDGTCDRTITITVDGNSRSVEVKKRG